MFIVFLQNTPKYCDSIVEGHYGEANGHSYMAEVCFCSKLNIQKYCLLFHVN